MALSGNSVVTSVSTVVFLNVTPTWDTVTGTGPHPFPVIRRRMNLGQRVVQDPDLGGLILLAVLPVRACPGGRRGPAAGAIGSSGIPCSQDGFSHGSCNRPAGRGDRSPPTRSSSTITPRTPRTTGRLPAPGQAEEIGAAPAHLRRDRARAELAESFGAGSVLDLPGRPPVDDPSCRGPRRPRAGRRRPGPAPDPDRGRRSRAVPGPGARAGPALGQAPPDRAGPPGRLHPGRKTRTGARPGPRDRPTTREPLN